MNLRETLCEILPSLLPIHASEAIKGKELIARVRGVLGDAYSDQTLRSQFSFLVLDDDSCLARVENGQGYYLRQEGESPSLHSIFDQPGSEEAQSPYSKALALAVRLYDTAGMGAFVYPVDEEDSWSHPDITAVAWPAGHWDDGAYIFEEGPEERRANFVAVCVAFVENAEDARRAVFRSLACSTWGARAELVLFAHPDDACTQELSQLAARFGVGIRCLYLEEGDLEAWPGADAIFKAAEHEVAELLRAIPQHQLAYPREFSALAGAEERPEIAAAMNWAKACLNKGRVESYELRVAVN